MLTAPAHSVLVNISLIAAAAPRLYNYLSKIPSGTSSFRIPSSLHLGRGRHYNRTATRATTNTRHSGNTRTSEIPRLVPDDYPATLTTHVSSHNQSSNGRTPDGTGGDRHSIEEDKASAARAKSAWSDGIHRTVKVHYLLESGEQENERGSGSSLTTADSGRG